MKYVYVAAALAGAATAQLSSLPQCGQNCITGMLQKAAELGCPNVNGQPDVSCLCKNVNFGYGIHDCTVQSCPAGTDVNSIIQYGQQYCASAASSGGSGSGASASSGSGSGSASATGGASGSAITTEAVLTTIVSNGSTQISTVGSTTIYAGGAGATGSGASAGGSASNSGASASGSASSAASSASGSAASGASSASSSASSAASSAASMATSAASSASSAAGGSSTGSHNAAPMMTAAANGMAGIAGLAAIMLL